MSDNDDRSGRRQSDMILAPNEYAFISDETKGEVNVFVGPNKTSLAGTDRPVAFDNKSKRFVNRDLAGATQTFQTAPEGWYVVLKNPAEGEKHPTGSGKLSTPNLRVGKKVNISGPASFALWPGQMARVIQGHNLRSNEYLLIRVYDEEAARANWSKAVIKTQTDGTPSADETATGSKASKASREKEAAKASLDIPSEKDLTMGKLFVIRGTDVSFYIPSTGLEVVPEAVDGKDRYVREAVTLERLEYCLLLDQDGNKRYVHGPAVVFPRPTEKFVEAPIKSSPERAKAKKFRAQELTPNSGIHIRVISDYTEEDNTERKAGEELFITGKEQTIYYPREEHATIKYGEQEIHYGIAIPIGEARYVLNRLTGDIRLVKGPQIFLPDPRSEVIAQRALPLGLCALIYPDNQTALEINAARLGIEDQDFSGGGGEALLNSGETRGYESYGATSAVVTPDTTRRVMIRGASKSLPGDSFDRKNKFTAPRSVVLNTKYDGAVTTELWNGYAMLLVRKNGERRVVQGPGSYMLEYDESPQTISLSTGKPKTTDNLYRTVFLLTRANKVSDVIEVETKDYCKLNVKLSYRVNFEGDDPEKWFAVDNYVKFLCDHMRSKLRSALQRMTIKEFYSNSVAILRDIILGAQKDDGKPRAGTAFEENNMRIYDVEVLNVAMQDKTIENQLVQAQRDAISNTLLLEQEERKLAFIQQSESYKRQVAETNAETRRRNLELQAESAKQQLAFDLAQIEAAAKTQAENAKNELDATKARGDVATLELQRTVTKRETEIALDKKAQENKLAFLQAEVQAVVDKAKAVSPDLVAALSAFGERAMVEKVAQSMAPLSIIGGDSVIDVLKRLLEGTNLAKQLNVPEVSSNGTSKSKSTHA
jgi:major vault protein